MKNSNLNYNQSIDECREKILSIINKWENGNEHLIQIDDEFMTTLYSTLKQLNETRTNSPIALFVKEQTYKELLIQLLESLKFEKEEDFDERQYWCQSTDFDYFTFKAGITKEILEELGVAPEIPFDWEEEREG